MECEDALREATRENDRLRRDKDRYLAMLRDVLDPFIHPRATSRRTHPAPRDWPEDDTLKLEVSAGDWLRLCAIAGTIDADYLRNLPLNAKPSQEFIVEIDRLCEHLIS